MQTSSPLSRAARLALASAALSLAACGGGDPPPATLVAGMGSVRRIELHAVDPPKVSLEVEVLIDLPELGAADWRRADGASGPEALQLGRGEITRAKLDLTDLEGSPNRAVLAVRAPTPMRAEVVLGAGNLELARAQALVQAAEGLGFTRLDLPRAAYAQRRASWIEIELERLDLGPAQRLPVIVEGGRLLSVDSRSVLPAPGARLCAGPTTLARPSLAVGPGERLAGLFVPREHERLRLLAAVPADHRAPRARPRLVAELLAPDGATRRAELALDDRPGESAWHALELELTEWTGREIEFELWLEEPDGAPFHGFVAEPLLVVRGQSAPTVLLVTSDTHRGDHLASAGRGVDVITPTLDALAARGARFADAWSSANSTNPSHVALLTGTSPAESGIVDNDTTLGEAAPTLAERFAEAGFLTVAATSAIHLGPRWSGLGQGFDAFGSPLIPQRDSAETLADLEAAIDGHAGLPLFVWLHLFDAHSPYQPPAQLLAPHWPAERDPFDPRAPGAQPWLAPDWDPTIADPRYTEALYRAEVGYVDAQLARLFERLPRLAEGWIAFTADHGEGLVGDPVPFDHEGLSPATLDVPLILAGPGIAPSTVETPARQTDVGRTLLDLAGLTAEPFPGRDLFANEGGTRFAFEANRWAATAERDGWLLSLTLRGPSGGQTRGALHSTRLFQVDDDAHMSRDLARAEVDRARALRAELVEWLVAHPPRAWTGAAVDGVGAQLALLGYAEGDAAVEDGRPWIDADCTCDQCRAWR